MRFLSIQLSFFALLTILPAIYAAPCQYADCSLQRRDGTSLTGTTLIVDSKDVVIGPRITDKKNHSCPVYHLNSWDSKIKEEKKPGYVIKILLQAPVDPKELPREIEALRLLEQFVAAGPVVMGNQKRDAIVMHEAQGRTLRSLWAYRPGEIVEIRKRWLSAVAEKAARIAKNHKMYHADLNDGNLTLVKIVINMDAETEADRVPLIDWGWYYKPGESLGPYGYTEDFEVIKETLEEHWNLRV
ncbi:hypothetical protein BDP27DRAFT_1524110 [Rhodocollybia butyracea]|uniref:Protein kinase domain-containing protein n=1 Tax=Rhodocollybia butyracea TaxID=206335 RepID=A0A9P5P4K8_9AGAR|nr:hypothetical protein BDP27DRAFT_1524110 [Rhodocollybia butyracea]